MPLIAYFNLPTFKHLKKEGNIVLSKNRATHQHIRELHIGLLNMMPDKALEATERQFFRLIGHSNQIAQFYIHLFTLPSIVRSGNVKKHVEKYYKNFATIQKQGLDAIIITGANITDRDLKKASFYQDLKQVFNWAYNNVTSILCSCIATHAVLDFHYQQKRRLMKNKCWGVFANKVSDFKHPLTSGVNTIFDIPHSRYNEITKQQFESVGVRVLVSSDKAGVHLCVSEDLLRIVFFQGHPEYDTISLLKEYKREIVCFLNKERVDYPSFPINYLNEQNQAILNEFKTYLLSAKLSIDDFPEKLISKTLENTWRDTANAIMNNWIGCVYQVTHKELKKPFMAGINPNNPFNFLNKT